MDDTDKSPGWKFSEQEMRGIPIRVEIGPKDIEAGKCVICRRDTREKIEVSLEEIETKAGEILELMQREMLERARAHSGEIRLCEGDVVRGAGLRGSDQGRDGSYQPLYAF